MENNKPKYKKIGSGINNKYILLEDWTIESYRSVPDHFRDKYVTIVKHNKKTIITIRKGFIWDGATLAPDFKTVIPGTIVHDALYERLCILSKYWNISREAVRRWADKVFNDINKEFNFWRPIKRIYYRAVRIFGRFVRLFSRK